MLKSLKTKDMQGFYLYLVGWFVISARFLMEISVGHMPHRYFLYFHHQFWFYSAFLAYMIFFRYIIGIRSDKIMRFALATPVVWIPILVHFITHNKVMKVNYLQMTDIKTYLLDIATFMMFHHRNYLMAPELITIFVGTLFLSYYISRSVVKSIITTTMSYLTLTLWLATIFVGPDQFKTPLFKVPSSIQPHLFFTSYHMINTFILITILFAPEIKRHILPTILTVKTALTTAVIFSLFYLHLIFFVPTLYGKTPSTADTIILAIHPLIYSLFVVVLRGKFRGIQLFMSVITAMSLTIIIPLFIGSHIR